ncbi:hemerythrin domain-containing protein [Piscinibacter sp. XHJ-5]|uniref:hemerythrin domain-containing protein n=1 Tax=Piscinibacter sp. XHJ-5 TaxID=3037797 RepID=UPI0024529B59|nr:hemerythrin domain-containing protein [Piscinibacter sp. XHJ-5]
MIAAASFDARQESARLDGLDVLDACHRQTLFTLGKLAALVSRLQHLGIDEEARAMAADVIRHFSTTARHHHEDEERHVFPALLAGGEPQVTDAVSRLQQDHRWLEEDWKALLPQLDAIACGQSWFDVDTLREGVEIFIALSHDHIALEESLIYPQARARMSGAQRREAGREMAARRRT